MPLICIDIIVHDDHTYLAATVRLPGDMTGYGKPGLYAT